MSQSVVKVVFIMIPTDKTNLVVVVLVGVILKVMFQNYRIYRKSIICEFLIMVAFFIGLTVGAFIGFIICAVLNANGRE